MLLLSSPSVSRVKLKKLSLDPLTFLLAILKDISLGERQ